MVLSSFDIIVIICYFAGLALFGLVVRRIRGLADYSVAQRRVPWLMIFASLSATFIGPGYSLGLAGQGFRSGFLYLLIFSCFSLQTILTGLILAPRLHRFSTSHSLGDVMGALYGPGAKLLTGVISVGLCTGLAAVMGRAGGAVLAEILGQPLWIGVLLITFVGVIYTTTGGLKSVISTEAIQFSLIVASISLVALFVRPHALDFDRIGPAAFEQTSRAALELGPLTLLGLCVSLFFGEMLIPPYANRALASESNSASRAGFFASGAFSVLWFAVVVSLGWLATLILAPDTGEDRVLLALAEKVLPSGLLGLFVVGLAAIVMSSQESVLNAGAVSFVRDLGLFSSAGEGRQLLASRVVTIVLGATAVLLALAAPSIISGLLICYSIWAPSIIPALVWGLFGRRRNAAAGIVSIAAGGCASGVLQVFGMSSATAILWGFLAAAGGALLGFLLGRRTT